MEVLSRNTTPTSTPVDPIDYREEPVALAQLHPCVRDIFDQLRSKTPVRDIKLQGKELGNQGALHLGLLLEHTLELRRLDVRECCFQWEGIANISLSLRRLRLLEVLEVSGNDLGLRGAQYLASALGFLKGLKTLGLSGTNLGAKGVRLVSQKLRDLQGLEELMLSDNHMCDDGGEELSRSLHLCPHLRLLDLSSNSLRDCVQQLQRPLKHLLLLQVLKLDGNQFGDTGADVLSDTLACLPDLRHLDLSYTDLTSLGIKSLQVGLSSLLELRELYLEGNNVGKAGGLALANAVSGLSKLQVMGLVNSGAREVRTELRLAAPAVDILL